MVGTQINGHCKAGATPYDGTSSGGQLADYSNRQHGWCLTEATE